MVLMQNEQWKSFTHSLINKRNISGSLVTFSEGQWDGERVYKRSRIFVHIPRRTSLDFSA